MMPRLVPLTLAAAAMAALVTGCSLVDVQTIRGSGDTVTTEHALSDFDRLEVRRSFDVRVTPGAADFRVVITTDDNVAEHLEVEVTGTTLRLDIDDGVNLSDATLTAEVALPELRRLGLHSGAEATLSEALNGDVIEVTLSGGSELACAGITAESLTFDLAGGSDASCSRVQVDELRATLNGGSELELTGESATADIDGSGGSAFELAGLALAGADIALAGASAAVVDVSGVLEADLRDGSRVSYAGDPVIGRTELEGGSELKPSASD